MAAIGKPTYPLPHVKLGKDSYDFSFSGLKSAVINLCNKLDMKNEELNANDLAASFQDAVVDVLREKTMRAAKEFGAKQIIVAGGVAANKGLRKVLEEAVAKENDLILTFPSFKYCTDNAAMIGVAGYFQDKCKK
jgi:N6-L-threonylcarbamoyladenine synthase